MTTETVTGQTPWLAVCEVDVGWVVDDAQNNMVASIPEGNCTSNPQDRARLIATAPDLLERLNRVVSSVMAFYEADRILGEDRVPSLHKQAKAEMFEAANEARDTIAKVTSEQP